MPLACGVCYWLDPCFKKLIWGGSGLFKEVQPYGSELRAERVVFRKKPHNVFAIGLEPLGEPMLLIMVLGIFIVRS